MFTRLNDDEFHCRKRELHRRIGRSRQRVERRLHRATGHARQLLSWRRHLARHPGWALLAALGGGMAAATILRPARLSRWLGRSLVSHALGGLRQEIWNDIVGVWTERRDGQ
jgi:hypothetical protein